MIDTLPQYRHHQSVPDRVDRAWGLGYESGKAERAERLAIVAVVLSALAFLRGRRVPWFLAPWVFIFAVAAVVPVLFVLACVGVFRAGQGGGRAIARHHRSRTLATHSSVMDSDGERF
jgi:hypothetical protein